MEIDEAIKRFERLQRIVAEHGETIDVEALSLGTEALKWIKWRRENYKQPPILPLAGETT